MTNTTPAPDIPPRYPSSGNRAALLLATGFGLGHVPRAPGTAGSLASVLLFALLHTWLSGSVLLWVYLLVLAGLAPLALWSTQQALPYWKISDPPAIVVDEILGQWVTYAGVILASLLQLPAGAGWKYLLVGFILFRAFDVVKPFPLRRSEHLPGVAGVVLDDILAGVYAGLGLLLLAWMRWLT